MRCLSTNQLGVPESGARWSAGAAEDLTSVLAMARSPHDPGRPQWSDVTHHPGIGQMTALHAAPGCGRDRCRRVTLDGRGSDELVEHGGRGHEEQAPGHRGGEIE